VVGSFIPGVGYRGKQGEAYSPLNHFISELGEAEVSRLAWAFDLGLILSGISLIGASISLGLMLPGLLSKLGMMAGVIRSIALVLIGRHFPDEQNSTLRACGNDLFPIWLTDDAVYQPCDWAAAGKCPGDTKGLQPGWAAGDSVLCQLLGDDGQIKKERDNNPLSLEDMERPKIWTKAIEEWSIFITIVIWFLVIAVGL
jgi:hypothetical protein